MALDNLLVAGDNVKADVLVTRFFSFSIDWFFVIVSVVLSVLFWLADRKIYQRILCSFSPMLDVFARLLLRGLIVSGTLAVIGVFCYFGLDLGIQQWIAIGSYSTLVAALAGEDVSRSLL